MGDSSNREQVVQSIFSYEYKGGNCLGATFKMMQKYSEKTYQMPDSSIVMFKEIESLFINLLQLAEQNNIEMDLVINNTNEAGTSLFHWASFYSKKISLELINRGVKVNRIDSKFCTPSFTVR